jgi:trehalose/maltose hydrolase-like predicted phosphorylase
MTPNKTKTKITTTMNINETQQKGGKYLFMGALIRLLQVERKICHHKPSTTFKDLTNNHYNYWDQLSHLAIIVVKCDNSSQQQVEKHCRMQS